MIWIRCRRWSLNKLRPGVSKEKIGKNFQKCELTQWSQICWDKMFVKFVIFCKMRNSDNYFAFSSPPLSTVLNLKQLNANSKQRFFMLFHNKVLDFDLFSQRTIDILPFSQKIRLVEVYLLKFLKKKIFVFQKLVNIGTNFFLGYCRQSLKKHVNQFFDNWFYNHCDKNGVWKFSRSKQTAKLS